MKLTYKEGRDEKWKESKGYKCPAPEALVLIALLPCLFFFAGDSLNWASIPYN